MRSRNQGGESSPGGQISCPKSSTISNADGKSLSEDTRKNRSHREEEDGVASGTIKRHVRPSGEGERQSAQSLELSKEDLIQLLSIMEGELQVELDLPNTVPSPQAMKLETVSLPPSLHCARHGPGGYISLIHLCIPNAWHKFAPNKYLLNEQRSE